MCSSHRFEGRKPEEIPFFAELKGDRNGCELHNKVFSESSALEDK